MAPVSLPPAASLAQPGSYSSAAEKMMMKMGYKSGNANFLSYRGAALNDAAPAPEKSKNCDVLALLKSSDLRSGTQHLNFLKFLNCFYKVV
jgi:hypothetical protein